LVISEARKLNKKRRTPRKTCSNSSSDTPFFAATCRNKKKGFETQFGLKNGFFQLRFFFGSRYRGVALSEANAFGPQLRLRVRGALKRDLLLNAPSSLEGEVIETRYFLLCERVFSALDEPQKMFREDSSRKNCHSKLRRALRIFWGLFIFRSGLS
jgi:hypothetical protein